MYISRFCLCCSSTWCQKGSTEGFLPSVISRATNLELCRQALGDHEFFSNVRGRGVRNSLEYSCDNQHKFGLYHTP